MTLQIMAFITILVTGWSIGYKIDKLWFQENEDEIPN